MSKKEVLVSIICSSYNHEKYIAEAIESFLMQEADFKFEIIIHDDASTDKTAVIIGEYYKKYPEIIIPIIQVENQYSKGISILESVASRAKGKYVAICEGDDYWTSPDKLKKQVDYMGGHPECGMCFHASEIVGGDKIDIIRPYNKSCISPTEDIILGGGGFMATNSIMYRRTIMDNPPDFYVNSPIEDYPLQIFTSTKNYAYYIDEVMSAYRIGVKGSWTDRMNSAKDRNERLIKHIKKIDIMLEGFNKYSGGKYSNSIKRKILKNESEILKISILNKMRKS
jgi:glycosyltransferase involved in cell wall biosynthesis